MALYLEPHSPEWLTALRAFNRQQAEHTNQILKLAGRTDVCSICGDHPASDFKIVGEVLPANAVATIRLCRDCRQKRSAMYGEKFEPLGK
jgi:hypothetical protein